MNIIKELLVRMQQNKIDTLEIKDVSFSTTNMHEQIKRDVVLHSEDLESILKGDIDYLSIVLVDKNPRLKEKEVNGRYDSSAKDCIPEIISHIIYNGGVDILVPAKVKTTRTFFKDYPFTLSNEIIMRTEFPEADLEYTDLVFLHKLRKHVISENWRSVALYMAEYRALDTKRMSYLLGILKEKGLAPQGKVCYVKNTTDNKEFFGYTDSSNEIRYFEV